MISLPGFVSKLMTMADSSVRIFFDAEELKPDVVSELYKHRKKPGIMVFIPDLDELSDEEKEMLDALGKRLKGSGSPSHRLRNTLFKYWKHLSGSSPDINPSFEEYYNKTVDDLIEYFEKKMR